MFEDHANQLPPMPSPGIASQVYASAQLQVASATAGNDDSGANLAQVVADALAGDNGAYPTIDELLSSLVEGSAPASNLQSLAEIYPLAGATEVAISHEFGMVDHGSELAGVVGW